MEQETLNGSSITATRSVPKRALAPEDYKFLTTELERMRDSGLASSDEVEKARALYSQRERPISNKLAVFVALNLLAVGSLAFFAYVALDEYWRVFPGIVKTLAAYVPFVLSYACFFVAKRKSRETPALLSLFAGGLFFALASAYSFYEYDVKVFGMSFIWFAAAIATFALACFTNYKCMHLLALFFIGATIIANADVSSRFQPSAPILLGDKSTFTCLALAGLGLYWAYRRAEPLVALGYWLMVGIWCFWLCVAWDFYHLTGYFACGIPLAGGLCALAEYCRRKGIFHYRPDLLPIFFLCVYLAFLSFGEFSGDSSFLDEYGRPRNYAALFPFGCAAVFAVVSAVLAFVTKKKEPEGGAKVSRWVRVLDALFSPVGVGLLSIPASFARAILPSGGSGPVGLAVMWYFNVLMACFALRCAVVGANGRPLYFFLGVGYFILWLCLRYADLVDEIGGGTTIASAGMFGIVAVSLFVVAAIFKRRVKRDPELGADKGERAIEREPRDLVAPRFAWYGVVVVVALEAAFVAIIPFV